MKKKTRMEELIERRFGLMRNAYAEGSEGFPTTVFIDFKWVTKEAKIKSKNTSIAVPIFFAENVEKIMCLKSLGLAAAILSLMGISSAPESVMIVSEAFASIQSEKEIKKQIKKGKIISPSEDPDRIDVAIIHAQDKDNKTLGSVQEIVTVCKEKNNNLYFLKDIAVTERIKKNKLDKMNKTFESPVTSAFWSGYNEGIISLKKENSEGLISYASFKELAENEPAKVVELVIEHALASIRN